jgi:ADP-ribose pyrophosphatase YjhB (NUDIX family)
VGAREPVARRKRDWIPGSLWNQVKGHMPIPCVDVILQKTCGEVLLGWRQIPPYRNVWALPGGRLLRGEDLRAAAKRIIAEYSLSAHDLYFVGVFPIRFPSRSDVPICVASMHPSGQAQPNGREFSSFRWTQKLPSRLGANYRRMIMRWRLITRKPQILQFSKL